MHKLTLIVLNNDDSAALNCVADLKTISNVLYEFFFQHIGRLVKSGLASTVNGSALCAINQCKQENVHKNNDLTKLLACGWMTFENSHIFNATCKGIGV